MHICRRNDSTFLTKTEQIRYQKHAYTDLWKIAIISSPEAHWWAYIVGRHLLSAIRLSTFSHIISSEATGPVEAEFYGEALWGGGTNLPSNSHGHMTKMATMPIYGKKVNLKNLLLYYRTADDLETWYAASGTRVLPNSFQWWPWVNLDIFHGKVRFGPWEKGNTMKFLETIVVYDIKVGRWSQLNEYMKRYEYQRSRSFIDLSPIHSDLIFSNVFSLIMVKPIEAKGPGLIRDLFGLVFSEKLKFLILWC